MKYSIALVCLHIIINGATSLKDEERATILSCDFFKILFDCEKAKTDSKLGAYSIKCKKESDNTSIGYLVKGDENPKDVKLFELYFNIEDKGGTEYYCFDFSSLNVEEFSKSEFNCVTLDTENEKHIEKFKQQTEDSKSIKEMMKDSNNFCDFTKFNQEDNPVMINFNSFKTVIDHMNFSLFSDHKLKQNDPIQIITETLKGITFKSSKRDININFKLCSFNQSENTSPRTESIAYYYISYDCTKELLSNEKIPVFFALLSFKIFIADDNNVKLILEAAESESSYTFSNSILYSQEINNEVEKMLQDDLSNLIEKVVIKSGEVSITSKASSLALVTIITDKFIQNSLIYIADKENNLAPQNDNNHLKSPLDIYNADNKHMFSLIKLDAGNVDLDKQDPLFNKDTEIIKREKLIDIMKTQLLRSNYIRMAFKHEATNTVIYFDIYDMEKTFFKSFLIKISTMYRFYEYLVPRTYYHQLKETLEPIITRLLNALIKQNKESNENKKNVAIDIDKVKIYLLSKLIDIPSCIHFTDKEENGYDFSLFSGVDHTKENNSPIKPIAVEDETKIKITKCPSYIDKNKNFKKILTMSSKIKDGHKSYQLSFNNIHLRKKKGLEEDKVDKIISTSFVFNERYDHDHTGFVLQDINKIFTDNSEEDVNTVYNEIKYEEPSKEENTRGIRRKRRLNISNDKSANYFANNSPHIHSPAYISGKFIDKYSSIAE